MKKSKTKNYETLRSFVDANQKKHTIFVYAEVTESYPRETIEHLKCVGKEIDDKFIITLTDARETPTVVKHRMRSFNMGYAICQSPDVFDHATAVKIAKSRFTRVPMTAINARYLNDDMAMALVENEANYILAHFAKFANEQVSIVEEISEKAADEPQKAKISEKPVLKEGDIAKIDDFTYCAIKTILGDGRYILYWVFQTSHDGTYKRFYSTDESHYCPNIVKCTADEARNVVNLLKRNFSVRWNLNTKNNS